MNFENLKINSETKENKDTLFFRVCKVDSDETTKEFVSIEKEDIVKVVQEINNILGSGWKGIENENIIYKTFSSREDFQNEKRSIGEYENEDNAYFNINQDNQEKTVLNYTPIPSKEDLLIAKSYGYSEQEIQDLIKKEIISSFAHETTHLHSFFKNHGNSKTNNLWEQEQICTYIGERIRGDISDKLLKEGYITEEKINNFKLEDGSWKSLENKKEIKEKNAVINFFYPFLIKEFGIEKVRGVWQRLQIDSSIREALEEVLNKKSEILEDSFKDKIKDINYLKDIFIE